MHLDNYQHYLHSEKRYSRHTVEAYLRDVNQLLTFLEEVYLGTPLEATKSSHLRSWQVSLMDEGVSATSVNRKLSSCRNYFRYLQRSGVVINNPFNTVTGPKTGQRLPQFARVTEMCALLDEIEFGSEFAGCRDRVVVSILYHSGVRRSEILSLRRADVDFSREILTVRGKGNKMRQVPGSPEMFRDIRNYVEACNEVGYAIHETLILTDQGKAGYPKMIYRIVQKYLGQVSTVRQKSPHVLRHSFATHLADEGADLNAIKTLLGHGSLAATQVYTHTSIGQLKEVYKQSHPKAKT